MNWDDLRFLVTLGREGTLVDPPVAHGAAGERVPYRYLLTCPSIVALCCTGFASYWGLALGLTWFTSYLVDGLGYSQTVGGNLSILPWIFGMVVVLSGGWISQRLKKAGVSSRVCRGAFAAATVTFGGCVLPFISYLIEDDFEIGEVEEEEERPGPDQDSGEDSDAQDLAPSVEAATGRAVASRSTVVAGAVTTTPSGSMASSTAARISPDTAMQGTPLETSP